MYEDFKKVIISFIVSPLFMFFEPYSALVHAIGILVIIDIVSGMLAARREGQDIKSRSFLKKVPQVVLFLVGLAAAKISNPLLMEFAIGAHQAGKWLCSLYGVYELLSILENLGRLGLPVASQLAELLKNKTKISQDKNDDNT